MKALALSLSTILIVGAAAPGARFNLQCVGTENSFGADKPFSETFRVDLVAKKFCEGECNGTVPLALVNDTAIFFRQNDDPSAKLAQYVDRTTGKYTEHLSDDGQSVAEVSAECTRKPFAGFPAVKRKF